MRETKSPPAENIDLEDIARSRRGDYFLERNQ